MNKKEQLKYLTNQIHLAMGNQPGDYSVENGHHVFKLPELTTVFKIRTIPEPDEFKNKRLSDFMETIKKSDVFKNKRVPKC